MRDDLKKLSFPLEFCGAEKRATIEYSNPFPCASNDEVDEESCFSELLSSTFYCRSYPSKHHVKSSTFSCSSGLEPSRPQSLPPAPFRPPRSSASCMHTSPSPCYPSPSPWFSGFGTRKMARCIYFLLRQTWLRENHVVEWRSCCGVLGEVPTCGILGSPGGEKTCLQCVVRGVMFWCCVLMLWRSSELARAGREKAKERWLSVCSDTGMRIGRRVLIDRIDVERKIQEVRIIRMVSKGEEPRTSNFKKTSRYSRYVKNREVHGFSSWTW